MWEEFIQQKNTSEAMKAAENPHHLGAGGYVAKIAKWRREEEERRLASLSDLFEGLDERSRNWVLARVPVFTPDESYRKRDHYKKDLEEKMRAISKQELIEFFATQQAQEEPPLQLANTGYVAPSSTGSIANVRYPVDEIQVDTPCSMAVTAHVFPNEPPLEYSWVQVVTMLAESCELDIPTDEGIEHYRDIVLNVNASPKTSGSNQDEPMLQSHVQVATTEGEQPSNDPISPRPPSPPPQRSASPPPQRPPSPPPQRPPLVPRMVRTYENRKSIDTSQQVHEHTEDQSFIFQ
uniref:Uncharacterized protein n=1 Tax=Setaria italica TaxID=4555 RepID=K3ZCK2_SETIT